MNVFLQGATTRQNLPVKRFGYILSAVFLVLSNVAYVLDWQATPYLFLFTLYLLTGSLWIPALIRPFYRWFGKYLIKPHDNMSDSGKKSEDQSEYFSEN